MRVFKTIGVLTATVSIAFACSCGDTSPRTEITTAAPAADAPSPSAVAGPLVVFLGDSLTAGYGLAEDQAFPALLESRLRTAGVAVRVVNAGVSGDTTAGGMARLDWLLRQHPDVVVVGLGANDALRGQPLGEIESNLREIVSRTKASGAKVLLLGMRIPTNYGPDYTEGFHALYARVARDERVELVPFLLDGVGGHPDRNQTDGIHPNAAGHAVVAGTVEPFLRRLLGR